MTDRRSEEVPRVDLRSLDAANDPALVDAVVNAVMDRVRSNTTERAQDLVVLRRARVYLLGAAAVLVAIATASVIAAPRHSDGGGPAIDPIARWAESGHVPTNGELLSVYQGYRP
jgi:hypothetical protein